MAKQRQTWERAYDKIRVVKEPGWITVPPATAAELDAVETLLGSKLPHSYREFMKRFGPGEFSGFVRMYPLTSRQKKPQETVAGTTATLQAHYPQHAQGYPNHQFLARLVYFGDSGTGDQYAWDPGAITCTRPYECRIYCLEHEAENQPATVGESFGKFVEQAVKNYLSNTPGRRGAVGPGVPFTPQFLRAKKNPSKRDLTAWLVGNNGTVRELAQAIRDGQQGAFPILADALEDAGCTHADLLHSCRDGDPEIDGVWVLQVLLGKR